MLPKFIDEFVNPEIVYKKSLSYEISIFDKVLSNGKAWNGTSIDSSRWSLSRDAVQFYLKWVSQEIHVE